MGRYDVMPCFCGSGKDSTWQFDARGIELCRTCEDCHDERMKQYRPEVLTDPNYYASEDIGPENTDDEDYPDNEEFDPDDFDDEDDEIYARSHYSHCHISISHWGLISVQRVLTK